MHPLTHFLVKDFYDVRCSLCAFFVIVAPTDITDRYIMRNTRDKLIGHVWISPLYYVACMHPFPLIMIFYGPDVSATKL